MVEWTLKTEATQKVGCRFCFNKTIISQHFNEMYGIECWI